MALTFAGGTATDVLASEVALQFAQLTSYYLRFNVTAFDATARCACGWVNHLVQSDHLFPQIP